MNIDWGIQFVKKNGEMRIGIISDTHGTLDERLKELLADVDEVWHAGDIGTMDVLEQLRQWKPLRAVFGNADGQDIRCELGRGNAMLRFDAGGADVLMTHIGGYPGKYATAVKKVMLSDPPKIFVSGHSHILKVMYDEKFGSLHINPGACGRMGFHLVRTAIVLTIEGGEPRDLQVIELGPR